MRYLILTLLLVFAVTAPGCGGGGLVAGTQQEGTGPDTDQDNLGADLEIAGWEILIDDKGFGPFNAGLTLTSRMVTSDPGMTDTDGDGIDDGQEYQLRTDPRSPDTDGDGLTDFEEWKRWLTSPVSVDTDGDARGPDPDKALAPNPDLFDGRELHFDADGNLLGSSTSPILADTDGDGETDYEEVGHAFRSLVIAEIPQAQIVVDGPIDVFLNVEYEESRGQESSYGTSVSTTKSSSTSSSTSNTLEEHLTLSAEVTVGAEAKTGIDGGVAVYGEVTAGIEGGWMWGSTETTSRESSQELQQENSRLETDRRDKTEIASSGTITAGITVQNTSPSTTVRLESLGIAIRHWQDDGLGGRVFKTLGTLRPPIPGFTLAPGARSPVIQVETSDVAPDVIRRFLAAPDSLHVSPAYFDLVDEEGIDFNFLAENAFAQTAMVEINYGDGRSETYRVATNVDRTDDGELAGIKMREVMTSILGKSWAEMPSDVDICGDRPLVLTEIDGYVGSAGFNDPQMPVRFWRTAMNRQGFRHCGDWGDIVLMPGDVITLSYAVDTDGDGLTDPTEEHFGTTGAVDSDGDTLGDAEETVLGWWAGAPGVSAAEKMVPQDRIVLAGLGYPRRVFSNPRLTDTDQDGLDDAEEKFKGTDPTAPDTDGDGTLDGADPFPLIPGRRLYVDVNVVPTAALPWGGAFTRLQDATAEALVSIAAVDTELPGVTPLIERVDAQRVRSGIPGQPDPNEGTLPPSILQVAADLVTEIWVADGEYVLTAAADTFTLVDCVGIYGGFTGSGFGGREERTRGARNENPISNGTVLQGNDVAEHVVWIDGVGRGAVLDGFVITGGTTKQDFTGPQAGTVSGHGGGIFCRDGSPTLRNLLVTGNDAAFGGGMHAFGGAPLLQNLWFTQNACNLANAEISAAPRSSLAGGGLHLFASNAEIRDCVFISNDGGERGGGLDATACTLLIEGCEFSANGSLLGGAFLGAGMYLESCNTVLRDCTCSENSTTAAATLTDLGVPDFEVCTNLVTWLTAESFGGRNDYRAGGAVYQDAGTLTAIQCVFTGNEASQGAGIRARGIGFDPESTNLAVIQCTFGGNRIVGGGSSIHLTYCRATLRNTIFGSGSRLETQIEALCPGLSADLAQAFDRNPSDPTAHTLTSVYTGSNVVVDNQNCLFEDLADPQRVLQTSLGNRVGPAGFVSAFDLRLRDDSLAIDAGNGLADFLPFEPGFQSPPGLDIRGTARMHDGDGDGLPEIDIGAHEWK